MMAEMERAESQGMNYYPATPLRTNFHFMMLYAKRVSREILIVARQQIKARIYLAKSAVRLEKKRRDEALEEQKYLMLQEQEDSQQNNVEELPEITDNTPQPLIKVVGKFTNLNGVL